MNIKLNIIRSKYNKYKFYYNEWDSNLYLFNKYMNNYYIIYTDFINNILFLYFNKFNPSVNKNNKINNLISNYLNKYDINKVNINYNNYNKNKILLKKIYKEDLENINNNINKIYFNIVEIKIFTSKIIIDIYVYNREKYLILTKIINLVLNDKTSTNKIKYSNNINKLLENKLKLLNNKLYLYNYYISQLFLNNLKFNSYNLIKIKNILSSLFLKRVLFNITNIKYFYLSNNITSNILKIKLNKDRSNSLLTTIRKSLMFAKIAKLNYKLTIKNLKKLFNIAINNEKKQKNIINIFKNYISLKNSSNILEKIFNNGANIHVIGLRLEAKGRLTKRLIASRTIKKLNNKGTLNNTYSSINKYSTSYFKGHEKSNINYTKKNNHNILGSYGIKYWVSTY